MASAPLDYARPQGRKIPLWFHGRKGELRHGYREGTEDQLGALGLILNTITL